MVVPLLDEGRSEPVEAVWDAISDGSLFDLLAGHGVDVTLLPDEDRAVVLSGLQDLRGVDADRRFGVSNDGLLLLVALATENIQLQDRTRHEATR
jgi:hypothetical protein